MNSVYLKKKAQKVYSRTFKDSLTLEKQLFTTFAGRKGKLYAYVLDAKEIQFNKTENTFMA